MLLKIKEYISKHFPTSRIQSVSRINLENSLIPLLKEVKPGIVLDIGAKGSPYKRYIRHINYLTLDVEEANSPDICCDLHEIKWESDYFDTIIATEVLEHCYDPKKAVNEMFRVLKPGGICIASTRFIYIYHPDPGDYYRFTWDSLKYLFSAFKNVSIYSHGNAFQSIWHIINNDYRPWRFVMNIFNPVFGRFSFKSKKFPLGFIVIAQK